MSPTYPPLPVAGGFHQICFVSDDRKAMQRFLNSQMGVPRFWEMDNATFENVTYRGAVGEFTIHLSLAYAGDMQIEVIEPVSGPSLYTEFLEKHGPGLHHMGFFPSDFDAAVRGFEDAGYPIAQGGHFGPTRFAYFDTEAACGSIMELIEDTREVRELFAVIKSGDF